MISKEIKSSFEIFFQIQRKEEFQLIKIPRIFNIVQIMIKLMLYFVIVVQLLEICSQTLVIVVFTLLENSWLEFLLRGTAFPIIL